MSGFAEVLKDLPSFATESDRLEMKAIRADLDKREGVMAAAKARDEGEAWTALIRLLPENVQSFLQIITLHDGSLGEALSRAIVLRAAEIGLPGLAGIAETHKPVVKAFDDEAGQ